MAGRKSTLKIGGKTLTLRLNFATLADIEDETGVNVMSKEGAQGLMSPKVLPKALIVMAGGEEQAGMTAAELAEALDFETMPQVTKAIEGLFKGTPG